MTPPQRPQFSGSCPGEQRIGTASNWARRYGRWSVQLVRTTESEPAIPASELMVVLGHLSTAGYGLAQGLPQLATCLHRSTEQGLYWADGEEADWSDVAVANLSVGGAVRSSPEPPSGPSSGASWPVMRSASSCEKPLRSRPA